MQAKKAGTKAYPRGQQRQLTLRGVPADLDNALRHESQRRGASLNRTVVELLREATGLAYVAVEQDHTDLDRFFGRWTAEEGRAFDKSVRKLRRVDAELWR